MAGVKSDRTTGTVRFWRGGGGGGGGGEGLKSVSGGRPLPRPPVRLLARTSVAMADRSASTAATAKVNASGGDATMADHTSAAPSHTVPPRRATNTATAAPAKPTDTMRPSMATAAGALGGEAA
jgi:hypothetical protein